MAKKPKEIEAEVVKPTSIKKASTSKKVSAKLEAHFAPPYIEPYTDEEQAENFQEIVDILRREQDFK